MDYDSIAKAGSMLGSGAVIVMDDTRCMRLGWKVFIPVTLVWIVFLGVMMQTPWAHLFH